LRGDKLIGQGEVGSDAQERIAAAVLEQSGEQGAVAVGRLDEDLGFLARACLERLDCARPGGPLHGKVAVEGEALAIHAGGHERKQY
jgi:hypothetical protein